MIRSHLSLALLLAVALAGAPPVQDDVCDAAARPAKLNFAFKDLNAASVKLSGFKGKIIVLNFWATWCVPCKAEIPDFVDLQARYGEQGLQLVGVAVDDPLAALKAYAGEAKMNYPVLQGHANDGIMDRVRDLETAGDGGHQPRRTGLPRARRSDREGCPRA